MIEGEDKINIIKEIISSISSKNSTIKADTKILEDGLIDSLSVFHIIAELEAKFGVSIGVMDATVEDFASPKDILTLVERIKKG